MAKVSRFLLFFLGLLTSVTSAAALLHIDTDTPTPLNLTPWLQVSHPSTTQLADIQNLSKQEWRNFTNKDIQKLSQHNFWLNISLNSTDESLSRILALDNPLLDKVTIYHLINQKPFNVVYMGDSLPYSERPLLSNIFLYPFKISANEEHTFYLHIETEGSAAVPLYLWSANDLAQIAESTAVEHGFQLGVLAAIGIFSLFIAVASGSFSYSYYSGYVLSMTLLVATINGFAFRFIWPEWPMLQQIMVPILLPVVMAFALMFTERFCNSNTIIAICCLFAATALYTFYSLGYYCHLSTMAQPYTLRLFQSPFSASSLWCSLLCKLSMGINLPDFTL